MAALIYAAGRSVQCTLRGVGTCHGSSHKPAQSERERRLVMSSGSNILTVRIRTLSEFNSRNSVGGSRWNLALASRVKHQSIGRGNFFRNLLVSQRTPRRLRGAELHGARARIKKKKSKDDVNNFEISLLEDDLAQLAVSLPLGLASFEGMFLVSWLASLRGLLPGSRGFFAAADLILCGVMFANCAVGWYALEHSRSGIDELEPRGKRKRKAVGPGLLNIASSLCLSFIPFANLFLWFRFASKQRHLPVKAKAAVVANGLIYEGPRFFALLLLLSGGLRVFFQVGLVSNIALLFGALHRPFEEARIKNEKVLMEVSRTKKIGGKKGQAKAKEISAEERESIERLRELEEFDMLLAQRNSSYSVSSGEKKPKDWSVGETMEWLGQKGLAKYASTFAENSIDGELLLQLTNNDFRDELKIQSFGDRKKLELFIRELKES